MLKWLRVHKLLVSVASAISIALIFVVFSQSFQSCIHANSYPEAQQTKPEGAAYFIGIWWWCSGVFLNENGVALTAIATVVMAAFTGTLWWSTASSAKLTEKTVDLAEKQFLMEGKQADLAERQHALARLQHIAANKPTLRLRSIALFPPFAGADSYFMPGQPVKGSLVVSNSGATDAKIIDSGYRFYWAADRLPMQPPLDNAEITELLFTDDPIAGYGSRAVVVQSKDVLSMAYSFNTQIAGGVRLYFMGYIHYADINGAERFMGFCREYNTTEAWAREGRFVPVDNPDYEYSD